MIKKILLSLIVFLCLAKTTYATSVVIVNPVRGTDFWTNNYSQLQTPESQYQIIEKNNLAATWLLRYDALDLPDLHRFLTNLNNQQEVGLFLEITPKLTTDANVVYRQSATWHAAKSILTVGYSVEDRIKIIDTAFTKFKAITGEYPKSVGAWWIDAGSLSYMKQKYKIEASLDVADQYSTDGYQVWGQYFSLPFTPSKSNALIHSENNKIGVVTMQWATRDPFNGYGNGVIDSTYSVQANDYLLRGLDANYFAKLLAIYPQTTVGLENDFDFSKFGSEYTKQLEIIAAYKSKGLIDYTMADFAKYYNNHQSEFNKLLINAADPVGTGGRAIWYQTPKYRIGIIANSNGVYIRDLRQYNDFSEEPCLKIACDNLDLARSFVSALDDVTYKNALKLDDGSITNLKVTNSSEVKIEYTNHSGQSRTIRLMDNDIEIQGAIKTLQSTIIDALQTVAKQHSEISPSRVSSGAWLPLPTQFWLNVIKFLVFVIVFIFLPGYVISNNKLTAFGVGIAVFTLVIFILGYLQIRILVYTLPIIATFLSFKMKRFPNIQLRKLSKLDFLLMLTFIAGVSSWLVTVFRSGLKFDYGLGFWGPNGHDMIWHLSLISELQRNFPPQNPDFAPELLHNYHYLFNLLLAQTGLITGIESGDLLFRLYPALIAVLIGVLMYKIAFFVAAGKNAKLAGLITVFFVYFGGSLGWINSFLVNRDFGGESTFWSQQSISTLLNPPFAISLVLLLSGINLYLQKKSKISIMLLWGVLIGFKAYAGILVLMFLGLVNLYKLLKKDFSELGLFIVSLTISLVIFLPSNYAGAGLLIFQPFWLIDSMIQFSDRLGNTRLALAIQTGQPLKIFYAYSIGFLLFLFGNFGARIIGFGGWKNLLRAPILSVIILIGFVLPLLFIQKGTNWNIVQFMYYSLMLSSIFVGLFFSQLIGRWKKIGVVICLVVCIGTIPTSINTMSQYLPNTPPAKLSNLELEALNFLAAQPQGIVLTQIFDEFDKQNMSTPIPLIAYAPSSYISAYSNHSSFFADTINLEILGIDYATRSNIARDVFRNSANGNQLLKQNSIGYVYSVNKKGFSLDTTKLGLDKIFENLEVTIYKVK